MDTVCGQHWSFDGEVLDIFGVKGQIYQRKFYLGLQLGSMVETPFQGTRGQIDGIMSAMTYGNHISRLSYLVIDEFRALHLYFEGALTIKDLVAAEEGEMSIKAQVTFGRGRFACVITPHPLKSFAFYDNAGKQIYQG